MYYLTCGMIIFYFHNFMLILAARFCRFYRSKTGAFFGLKRKKRRVLFSTHAEMGGLSYTHR